MPTTIGSDSMGPAWVRDPKVFIDRGRSMPDDRHCLERRYLRKDAAEQLWKSSTQGWKKTRPLWEELLNRTGLSADVLALDPP